MSLLSVPSCSWLWAWRGALKNFLGLAEGTPGVLFHFAVGLL